MDINNLNNLIDKINDAFRVASEENENVFFDVDDTLIEKNGSLTPLGEWVKQLDKKIDILTFGAWNKESIEKYGIKVNSITVIGEALMKGMADYDENSDLSKSVKYLVDNEEHKLVKHLIKV